MTFYFGGVDPATGQPKLTNENDDLAGLIGIANFKIAQAGETIKLNTTVAFVATTATMAVDLIGYLS